jgi:hypothetical protein
MDYKHLENMVFSKVVGSLPKEFHAVILGVDTVMTPYLKNYIMKKILVCLSLLVGACAAGSDSPESFAKKFCNCSENLGKAIGEKKENKISDKEFEKVRSGWQECMGPSDPRETMSPEEVVKFDEAFNKAVKEKCPKIAQNYGIN